jgi:hypothetical protein
VTDSPAASAHKVRVLITIDTEFWPSDPDFAIGVHRNDLRPERELLRDVFGVTPRGAFGLEYQLEIFRAHGLRAVYFVESLSPDVVGPGPLERTVAAILAAGQEVQLHVHTEWLRVVPNTILPGRMGQHMREFTLEEQAFLLRRSRDNLLAAGAPVVSAYRAGNFGASWETVRALAAIGLTFDSSHNAAVLGGACDMPTEAPLLQPTLRDGVWEVPVSCFEDLPGHHRHAQVSACSAGEMIHALRRAWEQRWYSFVIVTHSNELLTLKRDGPNPVAIGRLHRLCKFLAAHPDRFETVTFAQLDPGHMPGPEERVAPIRSNPFRTAWRVGEQLAQRWIG